MVTALNLTFPLKQDERSRASLQQLVAAFAGQIQPLLEKKLAESEVVHFARVLVIDDKYLQVLTEFDADPLTYTDFFLRELPQVLEKITSLVDGAPPWNELSDRISFFRFVQGRNVKALGASTDGDAHQGYLFSATGDTTVREMTAQLRPRASAQPPSLVTIDPRDIQSLLVVQPRAATVRHHLFRLGDTEAARAFVAGLSPMVTMADRGAGRVPETWVNVGFTFPGLRALQVPGDVLEQLDPFYVTGPDGGIMPGAVRASRSDPRAWWEGQFRTADVHCMVTVQSPSAENLERASDVVRSLALRNDVTELFPRRDPLGDGPVLESRFLGDRRRLHFGYVDGISQPEVCWSDSPGSPGKVDFRHFVLGYATREVSSAPRAGRAAELVRGSTYGAFVWIYQDVAAFQAFLRAEGRRLYPHLSAAAAEERLAAKLMGRWRDGTPLALSPHDTDGSLAEADDFDYSRDGAGAVCPLSAHIRVVNPRREKLATFVGKDVFVEEGVPRVIRRGAPYGPPLDGEDDDGHDRGLLGLFLCADLGRQFHRLAGWIQRNDFRPLYDADQRVRDLRVQDAVVANRATAGASTRLYLPGEGTNGGNAVLGPLPDFVHTKGTAFLLFPGRTMLRALAQAL
jgi:deferrochelatase/peroxidase EfeB